MSFSSFIRGHRFSQALVFFVIFATIATTWLGWITFQSSHDLHTLQKRQEEVTRLQGVVAQYDEVLTMSARMAAATGNRKWEERYRQFEPLLDDAIKKLVALQPRGVKAAEETDVANAKLVELENKSFQLIQQKRHGEAAAVLSSNAYEQQKITYTHGMKQLYSDIDAELGREWKRYQQKLSLAALALKIFFAISVLGWFLVFQRIRYWNQTLREMNKNLDAKVKDQAAKLASSSKMSALGEMAAGVAHEINNPLASIRILSSQLSELIQDSSVDRALIQEISAKIEKTTERIGKIVSGLRLISRDASKDRFDSVNLHSLIEETLNFCGERLKSREVALTIGEFPGDLRFEGRATEISQVLLNLLNNASDAVGGLREKWVKISVSKAESWIEIRVTDSGNGIPPEIAEKVFLPFFTTKEVGKGTGMGLSISRNIVRIHGGELEIDNRSANTCFVIRLPQNQSARRAA